LVSADTGVIASGTLIPSEDQSIIGYRRHLSILPNGSGQWGLKSRLLGIKAMTYRAQT
jgi:hypothetical protein